MMRMLWQKKAPSELRRGGSAASDAAILAIVAAAILSIVAAIVDNQIANNHADQAVASTVLLVDRWKYVLGTLNPNQRLDVDMTQETIAHQLAPDEMLEFCEGAKPVRAADLKDANCLTGQWSGSRVEVVGRGRDNQIVIRYWYVSKRNCRKFADRLGDAPRLVAIGINGKVTAQGFGGRTVGLTADQLKEQCGSDDNNIDAVFQFSATSGPGSAR